MTFVFRIPLIAAVAALAVLVGSPQAQAQVPGPPRAEVMPSVAADGVPPARVGAAFSWGAHTVPRWLSSTASWVWS